MLGRRPHARRPRRLWRGPRIQTSFSAPGSPVLVIHFLSNLFHSGSTTVKISTKAMLPKQTSRFFYFVSNCLETLAFNVKISSPCNPTVIFFSDFVIWISDSASSQIQGLLPCPVSCHCPLLSSFLFPPDLPCDSLFLYLFPCLFSPSLFIAKSCLSFKHQKSCHFFQEDKLEVLSYMYPKLHLFYTLNILHSDSFLRSLQPHEIVCSKMAGTTSI